MANTDSQFYFAETDGMIAGYLKFNFGDSQTGLKDCKALEIERIYVVKEYQGKGVAQVLYAKAIEGQSLSTEPEGRLKLECGANLTVFPFWPVNLIKKYGLCFS